MTVNTTDSSHNTPATDWQMLGEFELPVGFDTQNIINARLAEILLPLKLQADFLNRILKSAQSAGVRAGESNGAAREYGHIHFSVFAQFSHDIDGKTWGFFRIEKLGGAGRARNPLDHSIEFYLYIEGN
jgi:hypothetical protein